MIRFYTFNLPFKVTPMFGKVSAPNKRAARKLLRIIAKVRALPPKSDVWL